MVISNCGIVLRALTPAAQLLAICFRSCYRQTKERTGTLLFWPARQDLSSFCPSALRKSPNHDSIPQKIFVTGYDRKWTGSSHAENGSRLPMVDG